MQLPLSRTISKLLKITGIAVGSLILLMFLLPYLFPGFISGKIRQWAKGSIRSELNFSSARLSFFRHFPALTLTLYDFRLNGAAPFEQQTLVEADEVALGVDLSSVFSSRITIDKIFLTDAFINIQADTAGHANYNVYVPKTQQAPANPSDSGSASLKIKRILIEKSRLVYNDRSLPILINARGVDYDGNGDLSQAIFDLYTHMAIDSMDLYYNHQAYFVSKKVNADLVTRINTNSLALFFEKNDLQINQLPVAFTGRFEFLKDGYDMDFRLQSADSDLHDIFTAMPPEMLTWLSKTEVKGFGDIEASLVGSYIAARNIMPDLTLDMKIRNGYVSNAQAPSPVSNVFLNFQSRLPGLNPDSLSVIVDSLYFNIDKDYFSAVLKWKGFRQPYISARINSEMDLEKWHKAFGVAPFAVKGRYSLHLLADGNYATRVVRTTTLRKTKQDTVITSIPQFNLTSSLTNGYFKYASRPEAIKNISFNLDAFCTDDDYRHTRLSLDNINATVLSSYIKGYLRLGNAKTFPVDAELETVFHLSDLKKVAPLDSMDLAGDLSVHIKTKGNYQPDRRQFPVTTADLKLENGSIRTKYYPRPLEDIQVSAHIVSSKGSLKDLEVALTPVSFRFEGQPFTLKADLQNFNDLKYAIRSQGTLDLSKIYQVFALQGYDVKGLVETDLSLKGRQSDATAGRYNLLFNSGTMKVKDLVISTELFPQPFHISRGSFRFDQDKMWFDAFNASYGKTSLTLNGWLSNVIGYMTDPRAVLKGSFDLNSDYILADEFMAFAPPATPSTAPHTAVLTAGAAAKTPTAPPVTPSTSGTSSPASQPLTAASRTPASSPLTASIPAAKTPAAPTTTVASPASQPATPAGAAKASSQPATLPTPISSPSRASSTASAGQPTPAGQTGVILVPGNLSISFNAAAKKIKYNGIELDSFKGQMVVDSGKILLNKTGFTLIGAPVEMDAMYKSLSPQSALFDYHIDAKDFDVQRAYREIKLFHDMATSASKAQGIISLNYQLAGRLDGNMHAIYPSLKGGGVLSVSKVKVKGLKLFSAVTKETNKDVSDPDLSKVEIKSSINNNIITIDRTRMKVSAFKLRMEGQASFDGRLNLQFRVGLPPFGVIGIPLKITGTQDNPKVKAGHGNKKDELEETEDKDEDGKEN